LCRAVIEQLDRRTFTSFVLEPHRGTEELLKAVLADFGLVSRHDFVSSTLVRATRRELSTALRQFLMSLAALQAFAVIMIDQAQSLPVDVLQHIRMLSDIVSNDRLLQVVLIGEERLLHELARPELQQIAKRVTVRCRLGRIARDEMGDYISHRWAMAGGAA